MWVADEESVAALARVLGHVTCVRLIDELGVSEATVSDLAARLNLDQPRVSTHLALLRDAGMVDCRATGRQRVYALTGQAPAMALAALRTLAASVAGLAATPAREQPITADAPVRRARTCYDHMAGVAGVALLDRFLEERWLEPAKGRDLRLTERGEAMLARAGVNLELARRSRRAFAFACPDWTERRPHLAGALGAAVLTTLLERGRARLRPGERAVDLDLDDLMAFWGSCGG
jgi:DNA-binding transcriptional ArsR family regulator